MRNWLTYHKELEEELREMYSIRDKLRKERDELQRKNEHLRLRLEITSIASDPTVDLSEIHEEWSNREMENPTWERISTHPT